MPKLILEPTVRLKDLLTAVFILLVLLVFVVVWAHQKGVGEREQAYRSRRAAALSLVKLERLQALQSRYYQEIQPLMVGVGEGLAEDQDLEQVRNHLWRSLDETKNRNQAKIHDEQLEQAYAELYSRFPQSYPILSEGMRELKSLEDAVYKEFKTSVQSDIFSFKDGDKMRPKPDYKSAYLGNKLRGSAEEAKEHLQRRGDEVLRRSREFMLNIVMISDGSD